MISMFIQNTEVSNVLAGKVVDEFEVDGKEVKIRYPEMRDVDDLLEYINSVIEERKYLILLEKKDREEEVSWLSNVLEEVEKKEKLYLVVEVDGKVMGGASIDTEKEARSHVGDFAIALKKEIREIGIGTSLAKAIFSEAKEKLGVETIKFRVFEKNKRARNFYKKLGFEKRGRIEDDVCIDGEYQDSIIMQKKLE
ncbi:hypothetical protein AKJ57_00665 [candidate division MSBL1 archaeon SCGC-AAA259A05]|uniref:N-acetyltransferase domain-containing protein n=1 Tax=candidate division MSBL1 archaeon SCGC-AAA259A05 TaxID=1698259 RepID=A0A133UBK8_9EURY|nr:hypothetical protein AKJ57_00665 [candidate division MSBL1 archaeon SCGC-AAA259A05]